MVESKVKMPKEISQKCHLIIHTATVAAGAAAVTPLPMPDKIPITTAQTVMVISLAKVFGVTISDSVAQSLIAGKAEMGEKVGEVISNGLKEKANVALAGCAINAAGFTEAIGWAIADDFYRASIGEEPQNIIDEADKVKKLFENAKK